MTISELTKLHTQLYLQLRSDDDIRYYNEQNSAPSQKDFINTVMDFERESFNLHERLSLFMTKDYDKGVPQWLLNEAYKAFTEFWDEVLEIEIADRDYAKECRDIENDHLKNSDYL